MRRRVPLVPGALAAALVLLVVGVAPTGAQAAAADPLTSGGDPYFPAAGNAGYDVSHYELDISYDTADKSFDAKAIVDLRPTQPLTSFSLDLRGLVVTKVVVAGKRAAFAQADGELTITPRSRLTAGKRVSVTVYYGGTAGQPTDIEGVPYGWYAFDDGAMVVNEPEGASTWFPVNDIPSDKATYDIAITVPKGKTAVSNGRLTRTFTKGDETTWEWSAKDPMASYLATATVGDFDLKSYRTAGGLRIIDAVDRDLTPANRATTDASLALQPQMIDYFETILGPYPFESFGSIVDDDSVDYALETQTRPVYSEVANESTVVHELAHQWVGNSVTPRQWRDIWLNEGFATYSQWLWTEERGGRTTQAAFDATYARVATSSYWATTIGDPGPLGLFVTPVYTRGAATLHALRITVGDEAFFEILRRWTAENANGAVTSADWIELSEEVSGTELSAFFDAWLYTGVKPPAPVPAP